MKKINFLNKLVKDKKLELVDSSDEIKESYIKKSASNLNSAEILLNNNKLEESIALTYYSMYHMLTALLHKIGIKCENHSASIILMKELFNLDNSDISEAKEERIDKQYYTGFHITKEQVINAIKNAESFNDKVYDFISRINEKKIREYRDKFNKLVGL